MKRTLAVLLFSVLITIALAATGGEPGTPAAAGDHGSAASAPPPPSCTDPPIQCQTAQPNGKCTVPIQWFQDNANCQGNHKEIRIGKAEKLIIVHTTSIRTFTVSNFNRHPMTGAVCNWSTVGSLAQPFVDSNPGLHPDHTLTPKPGSNGCYKANFTLANGRTIDPHIIVNGN